MKRSPEIALRQAAAIHLTKNLARHERLMDRCEELASARRGDRIAALNAAARLMRADAGNLAMLARVAQIESIHRSIVDKFGGLTPHDAHSNSNFSKDRNDVRKRLFERFERIHLDEQAKLGKAIVDADNTERARYAGPA